MKTKFLLLLFVGAFSFSFGQCSETQKEKILLVGDSWAFFMNFDGTINTVAKDWGHSNIKYYTNLTLSENGAETDDFILPAKVTELQYRLNTMPNLEAVHLSIGGNDFLGSWNVNYTQAKTDSLADAVMARLDSIVNIIHNARPDVHIFWSGYVYTNFGEVIGAINPLLQSAHPFHGTWESMGFPTFSQLNSIQNWFQLKIRDRYASDPKFTYIHATGLMQYEFGQTSALEVSPFGTYAPFTVPMPEGDVNYPSPRNTMRDYGVTKDCFHLSAAGYRAFVGYHFQKFYHKFFMDDFYSLATTAKTGSISSTGTVSNELKVGKDGSEEYVAILDFDNSAMDLYTANNLQLFLKIEEKSGVDLLDLGQFEVSIINGSFGSSDAIEAADFSDNSGIEGSACVFGNNSTGKWVRLELPNSFNPGVVAQTKSQIRIKYTGSADALVKFTNAADEDFQPVLNLTYGNSTADISQVEKANLSIFPNPTNGIITIQTDEQIENLTIYNVSGIKVEQINNPSNTIDVQHLNAGMYIIQARINGKVVSTKFIKE